MNAQRNQLLRKLRPSRLLAVLFIGYMVFMTPAAFPDLMQHCKDLLRGRISCTRFVEAVDSQYGRMLTTEDTHHSLHNRGTYINLNGRMAGWMRQPQLNQRVLLKNGHLAQPEPVSPDPGELSWAARNVIRFHDLQTASGGKFLFVMAPTQISKFEDLLPVGYYDTANETADYFLSRLEEAGVPCLDLREELQKDGISVTDAFYVTDHHWTPQTGFWAFGKILDKLADIRAIAPVDPSYTNPDNYTFETHEHTFLGSSGKRTGIHFAGLDDAILIRPDFETDISVSVPQRDLQLRGSYQEVCYNTEAVHDYEHPNYYQDNVYGLYGWGDTEITHWRNETAPEQGKFLLIGDSFGNIPFSLMSICFSSCDEVDRRFFAEDFADYYAAYAPDTVILEVNAAMTLSENTAIAYPG